MSDETLKMLKNKRRGVKAAITRFENFLDQENITIAEIYSREEKFLLTYDEFNNIQSQIEELDESEYDSNEREIFENKYFKAKGHGEQLIKQFQEKVQITDSVPKVNTTLSNLVKLPTISLPSFSGLYEEWFAFHDTFHSLIHINEALSSIQKFHYLKSCLKGEAANVLHSLEVSASNYQIAWQMLQDRFSNKRLIIQRHIKAIYDLPCSFKENYSTLRQIVDGAMKHIRALTSLKRPSDTWDDFLIYIIHSKLDSLTLKEWEARLSNDEMPRFDELIKFLNHKCQTLEVISKPTKCEAFKVKSAIHLVTNKTLSCSFCSQSNHIVYRCRKLLKLPISDRIAEVKSKKLCFNCLKPNHISTQCRAGNCKICNLKHNSILHKPQDLDPSKELVPTDQVNIISNHSFNLKEQTQAFLSTALVHILDCKGNKHICRVLLDSGSQSNLITKSLADKLMLEKKHTKISISGINQSLVKANHIVKACIQSLNTNFETNVDCIVLDKISERIPLISLPSDSVNIPRNLKLADPEFYLSRQVDLLLGVELFYTLLCVGQIQLGKNQPCLQKTLLGWLVTGKVTINEVPDTSICNISTIGELNGNIVKFWELENLNKNLSFSPEELQCESHFLGTTERYREGRFGVSLPFKINVSSLSKSHLLSNSLWWNGPSFLTQKKCYWPEARPFERGEELPESKRIINLVNNHQHDLNLFTRYSNLNKLQRIVAYCLRFKNNVISRISKDFTNIKHGSLSLIELDNGMTVLLKSCQSESFSKEYQQLYDNGKVNSNSSLLCLNPFIDEQGLIRVGGRLKHSNIPYKQKHQVLLPSKHPLTRLIVRNEHEKQLHAGVQLTIASLRSTYWPLSVKNIVKSVIRTCLTCFKVKPKNVNYIMGNLPAKRVTPTRPFQNVGADYFGPISLREGSRRKFKLVKSYGAVFICFVTKAVHIELVSDLTTEAFLAALKRFTSRRGKVANLYSDNGTQFVGANKELAKLMKQFLSQINQSKIYEHLIHEGTKWHFIPPRAPHFGGLWEAAIKSVKSHLARVIGKTSLNYEEMYTLLVQIEGILNSRPITPISNDPNDLSVLTPSHFLTGDIITSMAEPSLIDLKASTLSRWQYVQQLRDHFWRRWNKEYLNQLQTRHKWKCNGKNQLKEGVLVILREDGVPSTHWITGRIVQLFPGEDGIARAASVRTSRGVFQRPASKLCVLPIHDGDP